MTGEPTELTLPAEGQGEGKGGLDPNIIAARADGAAIADAVVRFARLLRAAGLPVGPDRTVLATRAVVAAGIESPQVLYWALHAALVGRPEQREIFDQAFHAFWKHPGWQSETSSSIEGNRDNETAGQPLARRLADLLLPHDARHARDASPELVGIESYSFEEVLRQKDFEQMTAAEQRLARRLIARMTLLLEEIPTRRFERSQRGERIDLRRVLRETAAHGSDHIVLAFRRRKVRRPPLVVLCDISGSMESYARIFLHFVYALTNARECVHTFLFGTRLTHVTPLLRGRDPDKAVAKVGHDVKDWSGGTRIGANLAEFNRLWGRRVLAQGALVLLFTDGLDREDGEGVAAAARRLRASCRRLVWVNPLLRYDRYAPAALGARALHPHVSEVRACHNLDSLEHLAAALSGRASPRAAESGIKAA
jgi:uncharacterized protein